MIKESKKTAQEIPMWVEVLKSKIHRARVTDANLHYEGSLTVDKELLERVNLHAFERISIYNISNGNRLDTYIIEGKAGSKEIIANGAAAHLVHKGDVIIIACYAYIPADHVAQHQARIAILDESNHVTSVTP